MLEIFKLEKLRIEAFSGADRKSPIDQFEAMFNPAEIVQSHEVQWTRNAVANASGSQLEYSFSEPEGIRLRLLLDGTGADQLGAVSVFQGLTGTAQSVDSRIKKFKNVTYDYDGNIHEPRYLRASWGKQLSFNCRLSKLDIKYTLFDRDGSALRAELDIVLLSDEGLEALTKKENKQSPDITHARVVRAGDTLPLLTKSIYGSVDRYLDVARFNDIDDFRALTPGQEVLFPPLAAFDPKPSSQG